MNNVLITDEQRALLLANDRCEDFARCLVPTQAEEPAYTESIGFICKLNSGVSVSRGDDGMKKNRDDKTTHKLAKDNWSQNSDSGWCGRCCV
ncbi:MAG: hypothetical protein K2X51_00030 [Burkholderiales bacterium]|nr:hypothetical protein [Burkholderiales bacterium]